MINNRNPKFLVQICIFARTFSISQKMTKIIKFTYFIVFAMFIQFGCKNSSNQNPTLSSSTLEQIVSKKEMRVGYLVFSPCVIKNTQSGELSGIFVDMINQIAQSLNVKVTWVETTLANFTAGLKTNQFDFCVGPTFVTIPRATAVSFTQPINYVGNSAVIKKNGKFKPTKIEDLNQKGIKISVLQGQAMEEFCKRNFPNAELVSMAGGDLTAPLVAVSTGNTDIGFMNHVTVSNYSKEHKEVDVVFTGNSQVEILPLSWTTKPNDYELMNFLNSSISYLKSTNRIAQYQKKYDIQLLYDFPLIQTLR